MIKLMCADLSLFCAYRYAAVEDDRVGVFIAGHPLIPDTCYYEAEIMDTGMDGSISVGLCSSDVHWMCMLAVQLSPLDLWWMMEGVLQFVISEVVDFEK